MKRRAERGASGRSRARAAAPAAAVPESVRGDVVKLNTGALRRKALRDYRRAEESLARLTEQLKQYHEHDIPGFRAWMHRAFGRLLTKQRDLLNAIEEKRTLLMEIEQCAHLQGLSFVAAYRKILWRRAHPKEAEEEDRTMAAEAGGGADEGGAGPFAADDSADPDDNWDEFADMFERFTGARPPRRPGGKAAQAGSADEKSARDLYRAIVRRLHPDHHGSMSDARKSLWHEAQQAYRMHDVGALHSILARCEDGEGGIGEHTPVSVIHRLILQFKKTAQAAGREVRRAKASPEWNFERKVRDVHFVRRIRHELEDTVREAEWQLEIMTDTLSQLERAAAGRDRGGMRHRHPRFDSADDDLDIMF